MRRNDLSGGDFERGKQCCRAMPLVVVALAGQGAAIGQLQIALRSSAGQIDGVATGLLTALHIAARDAYSVWGLGALRTCATTFKPPARTCLAAPNGPPCPSGCRARPADFRVRAHLRAIRRREFSAHSTWWWRLAIHWRPEAVRFRYSMPSSRCIETGFQKNSGYLSTRSAGDGYPSFRFMPVSSNSWKSAFAFLVYMGSPSCPIRSAAWTRRGRTSASVAFLSGGDGNRGYSIALAIPPTSIPGDFPSRSMANSFERSTW